MSEGVWKRKAAEQVHKGIFRADIYSTMDGRIVAGVFGPTEAIANNYAAVATAAPEMVLRLDALVTQFGAHTPPCGCALRAARAFVIKTKGAH